ncbi:13386_t:CDS:2, partial [Ambispora leptoticha]
FEFVDFWTQEELYKSNPSLIYTRVSGYGQTGPYATKPGYASVCEGMAGFRYINGFPGGPPVRPNMSLGDSVAGLTAALGVTLGLLAKNKLANASKSVTGQVIDVAIYESMFNMMEGILPEYDRFGEIRQPSGTTLTGIVPTNAYPCSDNKYVIIGGNGDGIYKRLMRTAGREDLTTSDYETNKERVIHKDLIDSAISDWTRTLTAKEVVEKLENAGVPTGLIYNIEDFVNDEHVKARGILEVVRVERRGKIEKSGSEKSNNNESDKDDDGWDLTIPAITPKLESTPGETLWAGPDVGQHNREIFYDILELNEDRVKELQASGVIGETI